MTVQINVGGRDIPFRLNWEDRRWQSLEEQKESDFPLIAIVGDKRYELYSDETFAEVERGPKAAEDNDHADDRN